MNSVANAEILGVEPKKLRMYSRISAGSFREYTCGRSRLRLRLRCGVDSGGGGAVEKRDNAVQQSNERSFDCGHRTTWCVVARAFAFAFVCVCVCLYVRACVHVYESERNAHSAPQAATP